MKTPGRLTLTILLLCATPASSQERPPGPASMRTPADLPARVQGAPAERPAETAERRRERLLFLLSGYEFFPSRDELGEAPDAELSATLREVAADATLRPSLRARAVTALGYFDDDATADALTRWANVDMRRVKPKLRPGADAMRHRAIAALARARGARALPTLAALFSHDDLQVRVSALRAAGSVGAPAHATLRAQRARAETALERETIDALLR
jgi:HEAT repeat protein